MHTPIQHQYQNNFFAICITLVLFMPSSAFAQWQKANWWSFEYLYNRFSYVEPGVMTEEGSLPGYRAELGFSLGGVISFSAHAQSYRGNLHYSGATFGGTPVEQVTKDKISTYGGKAHFIFDPIILSVGWSRRYLFNDLVVSYRREQFYYYVPVTLTYDMNPFYFSLEHRQFLEGENKSYMSDTSSSRRDVTFTQKDGKGYMAEVGVLLPANSVATKVSVRYERWEVEASDIQSDGVDTLVEPKNHTSELVFGIGLIF